MTWFVSYSGRDHSVDDLARIEAALSRLSTVYIDDLQAVFDDSRSDAVKRALDESSLFVGVESLNYLRTEWTVAELRRALELHIPVLSVQPMNSYNSLLLRRMNGAWWPRVSVAGPRSWSELSGPSRPLSSVLSPTQPPTGLASSAASQIIAPVDVADRGWVLEVSSEPWPEVPRDRDNPAARSPWFP